MAVITIGGGLGAGKTTLATRLTSALGYEELYVGGIFRDIAASRGMTIEQFYAAIKNDAALETSIDDRQAKFMREKDNIIVQGRVAWYFAQRSPFKVINILLTVDPTIGAQRVTERKENAGRSVEEVERANAERMEHERERYKNLYGIDNYTDPAHYNVTLDTSHLTKDEVLNRILKEIKEKM